MSVHVTAICLAAGRSERMGRPKLHLPWGDTTILGATLTALCTAGLDEIIVVARSADGEAARTAAMFGARLIAAPTGIETPTRSLQAGLAALTPAANPASATAPGDALTPSVLVMPGDMPLVTAATIAAVLTAFGDDTDAIGLVIAAARGGRRGHPVLFGAAHVPALAALEAGVRPREAVRAAEAAGALRLVAVPDDGIFADIDDEATYERLRTRLAGRG